MQDDRPNRKPEEDTAGEIDRFEDLLRKLSQVPTEEVDEEHHKWEREKREREKRAG